MRALVWFRSDLRTADNPALAWASANADAGVIGLFLLCPQQWHAHDWGAPKADFILRSVAALRDRLARLNIPLLLRTADTFDDAPDTLASLARKFNCDTLCFNRELEFNERKRDAAAIARLETLGLNIRAFSDQTLAEPGSLLTGDDRYYKVFTPFRKALYTRLREEGLPQEHATPQKQSPLNVESDPLPDAVPGFDCPASRIVELWPAGETEAQRRLTRFLSARAVNYATRRDFPGQPGTSELSPYLAVGSISIAQCLRAAAEANRGRLENGSKGLDVWISELAWREFYRHVLVGFERVSRGRAFRRETERIHWRNDPPALAAWCEGRTGVPIVDAGMRQLEQTGWLHNRLRMIVAQYLTKDLLIDWRLGEQHFARRLIDLDLASNNGGWQWSASTGTDAAPYFRIFNPWSQARRYDPQGTYIRRFVPELADLEAACLTDSGKLTPALRRKTGYPDELVDHADARLRALAAFKALDE